jgi:hypothetical protein
VVEKGAKSMIATYPDGSVVPYPRNCVPANPRGSNDLLNISRFESFIAKIPTERYYHGVHQRFDSGRAEFLAKMSQNDLSPIRWESPEEYPQNIGRTLVDLPHLQSLQNPSLYPSGLSGPFDLGTLNLHFLAIFKLHFLSLRAAFGPSVPESSFVYFQHPNGSIEPAVIQEVIEGTLLWDMVSRDWEDAATGLAPPWQEYSALLHQELAKYCRSSGLVDFNLMNFIFVPDKKALYYVESKPPFFRTSRRNAFNQELINKIFVDCMPVATASPADDVRSKRPPVVHRSWLGRFLGH